MTNEILILAGTAATLGFVHTVLGPDHYLPFIVMAKARKWKLYKTIVITALCGLGHVGSSIVVGSLGIGLGIGINKLTGFESVRGSIAAWAFIVFGFLYMCWGIWRAIKNKPHKHIHIHDNEVHTHEHTHEEDHDHIHKKNITPWILFLIFVLGPCEPLIPMLMFPAAESNTWGVILVASVFSIVTISTMLTIVILLSQGVKILNIGKVERYTHAIAGGIIFLSGFAIQFLGL